MKTTIELPENTFRQAKAVAAITGVTLKRFFTDAVEHQLGRYAAGRANSRETGSGGVLPEPSWMAGFGELANLRGEHRLVLKTIEDEFGRLTPDDTP